MKKTILAMMLLLMAALLLMTACGGEPVSDDGGDSQTTTTVETTVETTIETTTEAPATPAEPTYQNTKFDGKTLKVLAIGNSFSDDSMEWLFYIAHAEGVETIILGNLYWGGCDLQTHCNNAKNNVAQYEYRKNTNGRWVTRQNSTLEYGITDEDWDIITMQQVSGKSGLAGTYRVYLDQLVSYVDGLKTNPDCQYAWNMTWAYQSDSTHSDFPSYGNNQMRMYNAIVNAVKNMVLTRDDFPIVLTPGTAVQNMRTSFVGDTLTRDGYHLDYELGRYIAGYTWFRILTGKPLEELKYNRGFDQKTLDAVLEAVNAAAEKPFEVTQSSYPATGEDKPTIDLDQYTEIKFSYTVKGYWQSDSAQNYNKVVTTADNSGYFIATELFNKDTLPAGSVIVIDKGYQYRPERWNGNSVQTDRPNPVTTEYFVIPESWWDGYTYRAFNISVANTARAITEADVVHFRIYVPKGTVIPDTDVSFA